MFTGLLEVNTKVDDTQITSSSCRCQYVPAFHVYAIPTAQHGYCRIHVSFVDPSLSIIGAYIMSVVVSFVAPLTALPASCLIHPRRD